jgi:RNA polymerase sigma-70 factor (ECF subfamily)
MPVVRNSNGEFDLAGLVAGKQDPDAQRMVRVREGNAAAFDQLVSRYQTPVRSYLAHRLNDRENAEDLTQEVFMRVFRARRSYEPRSKFSTWLFTIVNNVAANAHRRRAARREFVVSRMGLADGISEQEVLSCPDHHEPPLQRLQRSEARQAVHAAIGTLNERQRTAIRLCKMQGLSYAEVAREMQITTKAVKSLLNRAKVNLHEALVDYVEAGCEIPPGQG